MNTRIYALLMVWILLHGFCHGQKNTSAISGKVVDENSLPIEYASVAVYNADKVVAGTVTDSLGVFTIRVPVSADACRLAVNFVGYARHEVMFRAAQPRVDMGVITLKNDAVVLNGVVVYGKTDAHQSNIERTRISAAAIVNASKGTALDILATSSAVSVSRDAIALRGNSNVLILLDGIPTTVTDLSTIPAANIKDIEIVTNPDASYDSEGTGGIINIISKKERAAGLSGVVSANYGFSHFANGNAAVSYNTPRASYRFNYNTRYEDDVLDGTLDRQVYASDSHTHQQMQSRRYVFNTNIGIGADFRIDRRNTLSIDLKGMLPRLNVKQDLHNTYTANGSSRQEERHNDVTWNRENIEAVVSYRHIVKPEMKEWTMRGSVSKIWGHRPSYYYLGETMVNRSNSGGSPLITTFQADYKQKLPKGTLTTGGKMTFRRNDIYHRFYSISDGVEKYSELLSNDLLHTELIPAAYVTYASKIGKYISYKAGIRGEYSRVTLDSQHSSVDDSRGDLFIAPNLSATYTLSDAQEFSFAFSRRIGRPTYPQLNPYMSMVDATTYEQGNMELKPEKSTNIDMGYSLKAGRAQIFANAYFNYTKDYITQITTIRNDLLITTYINTPNDYRTGLDLSAKLKATQWLNLTLSTNTFHVDIKGTQNGMDISNSGWTNNSNLLVDLLPTKTTGIQLQYFLSSPQYYAQLTTEFTHHLDIAIRQRLLNGQMAVTASLTDVFNTQKWTVTSANQQFNMRNYSTNKSRMFWLGLTYNFNSFKQNKQEKKGNDDRNLIRLGL